VREIFMPHNLTAELARPDSPPADVMVVDITQLQGMALTVLKTRRERGDQAPAIILAARLSPEAGRDLFRLGVRDFLLKHRFDHDGSA
jgi:DNA-binding NarL/FixJ family response regulator